MSMHAAVTMSTSTDTSTHPPTLLRCMAYLRHSPRVLAEAYPGNTLAKLHNLSVQLLSEGLRDLGILPGASLDDITRGLYR